MATCTVHRCNVHGVSSKKIKRMLSMYEHNITAQSLYAMLLPPIVCDINRPPPAVTTPGSSCVDNSQSVVSGSQLIRAPATTRQSLVCDIQPPPAIATSDRSCNDSRSVICDQLIASTVPSSSSNDSQSVICGDQLAATTTNSSCNRDSPPRQTSAVTNLYFHPASSSSFAAEAIVMEAVDRGRAAASAVNTHRFYAASPSLSGPADEAIIIVTEAVDSMNASDVVATRCGSSADMEADATCCGESRAVCDTQLEPDQANSISLDPFDGTPRTQTSDTLLSASSATDAETSAKASGGELGDRAGHQCQQQLKETSCALKSAVRQNETPNNEQICTDTERLKHSTTDETECLIPAHLADVNGDKKFPEDSFHCDHTESVSDQGQHSEAYDTDNSIDRHRAAELSCGITEVEPAATDVVLQPIVPADPAETDVNQQTLPQCLEKDCSAVSEGEVENAEISYCGAPPRTTELLYWEQTGDSDGSVGGCNGEETQTETVDVLSSETPMAELLASETEPKPRRMRPPKKPVSSLMESIMAGGKEWVSECTGRSKECTSECTGHGWNASENSPPADRGHCCTNVDSSHHEEECLASLEHQSSNSTQTEPSDFVTLTKITDSDEVVDTANYVAVVETTPRVISLSSLPSGQTSPKIPLRSVLHKSSSTTDETKTLDGPSQLEFLASCFPTISLRDLRELLDNCGNDTVVAADLLFEFGYEFNEPQDDVADRRSSSTSGTDSAASSPSQSSAVENNSPSTKSVRSRKNTSALYRLYRDSILPKGVALQSRKIPTHCEEQVSVSSPASSQYNCLLCFV